MKEGLQLYYTETPAVKFSEHICFRRPQGDYFHKVNIMSIVSSNRTFDSSFTP